MQWRIELKAKAAQAINNLMHSTGNAFWLIGQGRDTFQNMANR